MTDYNGFVVSRDGVITSVLGFMRTVIVGYGRATRDSAMVDIRGANFATSIIMTFVKVISFDPGRFACISVFSFIATGQNPMRSIC